MKKTRIGREVQKMIKMWDRKGGEDTKNIMVRKIMRQRRYESNGMEEERRGEQRRAGGKRETGRGEREKEGGQWSDKGTGWDDWQ